MRALANYIMRGRMQAALVVGLTAALPLLFWLSAAGAALVLLRAGLAQSAGVIVWALIPAMVWAYLGDPYVLLVIVGTLVLANALRETTSWLTVLMVSIGVGLVSMVVLSTAFAEPIAALVRAVGEALPEVFDEVYEQLSADEQARLQALLTPVLTGLLAAVVQVFSLACLILARYWQAALYNPGGFGQEFRAIKLPVAVAGLLVMGMFLAPNIAIEATVITPLCAVPLAFVGLAVVHGLIAKYRLGKFWLMGLYLGLILFIQLVYPFLMVLALADSAFDFRGTKAAKNDA